MEPSTGRSGLHRPSGLRGGIVIGLALALAGAAVGTATGAVTPFQQVVVVNSPAQPIPVTGTVSVGNTPANQNVTVTNLSGNPVPVSGTVNIGNVPATEKVSQVFSLKLSFDALETASFPFGRTINVSTLAIMNPDDDSLQVILGAVGLPAVLRDGEDGSFTEHFTMPVPSTVVTVICLNIVLDCEVRVTALGS